MDNKVKNFFTADINILTFFKILGFVGFVAFIYYMTELVALLFFSYVIYAALNTLVNKIQEVQIGKLKINRTSSIIIVSLGISGLLFFLIWAVIGPSTQEALKLFSEFDSLVEDVKNRYKLDYIFGQFDFIDVQSKIGTEISNTLSKFLENPQGLLTFGRSVFGGLLTTVTIISITVYQISQPGKIKDLIVSFFYKKDREIAEKVMLEVEDNLGKWLGGQVFLMVLIGLLSYIGLSLIGIPFALPLAIILGLLDIIPIIGPIVGFIPLAVVALATAEPWQSVAALIFFVFIQQIEGNFLVPKIMQKSVGLDPVLVIVALMIGSQLLGVLGAIISIPVAVIIVILYQNWMKIKDDKDNIENEKDTSIQFNKSQSKVIASSKGIQKSSSK